MLIVESSRRWTATSIDGSSDQIVERHAGADVAAALFEFDQSFGLLGQAWHSRDGAGTRRQRSEADEKFLRLTAMAAPRIDDPRSALPTTLVEVAEHRVRDAILSGALQPGQKVVEEQ
ncbi:MAG TPA: hypothetical protein VGA66_13770, partial [Mycobacterium sp.]